MASAITWLPPAKSRRIMEGSKMAEQLPFVVGNEVEVLVEAPIDNQGIEVIDTQPMIALQPLAETEPDELIIQTSEEIIDDSQEVPIIGEEQEISSMPTSPKEKKRKSKSGKGKSSSGSGKKSSKSKTSQGNEEESVLHELDKPRKWEQKKVQIKTLEGEFSVTMWASGAPYFLLA